MSASLTRTDWRCCTPTRRFRDRVVPAREDFNTVLQSGIRQQLKLIYGPARAFDVRLPLIHTATGKPFGEVRVGVYTAFLKQEIQPQIRRALVFSGTAIILSLILAAGLSNLALRPLAAISRAPGFNQLRQG